MTLQRYRRHKEVNAARIERIHILEHVAWITLEKESPIPMPREWVERHAPEPGGYLVIYDDGYRSYSPAAAFEAGYTPV